MESDFSVLKNKTTHKLIWDDIQIFLAVAHGGTLGNPAKSLGLGISTVGRRIERLEESLGQRLFVHHQSGYKLTTEGAAMLPEAESIEASMNSLLTRVTEPKDVVGSVRLATTDMVANELILPALHQLQESHLSLSLQIVTDAKIVNIHQVDADLALRLVKPERGNVTVRRLGVMGFGLYGSQPFIDNIKFRSREELYIRGQFIGWTKQQSHLPTARWLTNKLNGKSLVLETSSLTTQVAAVDAGVGIALLPHFVANRRGLICLDIPPDIDYPLWLVTHSDLSHTPRVRAVSEFLAKVIHSNKNVLTGPLFIFDDWSRSDNELSTYGNDEH
ncbi:LysR family transcriptional regulator [Atlantibacter subterranea]|uniref:LysR family transcriptional regulator n=1 Tax=Atlantibacter subterraneus TaxID=255519 RepID=UPI0020C44E45|nr:LysR family transcriptional regulator [Atlantibacter subterranea]UTJ46776.1 LysR family transcriptional regulator [Atlantibacter subterranea]